MGEAILSLILILGVLGLWWVLGNIMSHIRIHEYVKNNMGGTVIKVTWTLFGPGWLGEKDSSIYHVKYRAQNGEIRTCYCKTAILSGVYMTEDKPYVPELEKNPDSTPTVFDNTIDAQISAILERRAAAATSAANFPEDHDEPLDYPDYPDLLSEVRQLRVENKRLRRELANNQK